VRFHSAMAAVGVAVTIPAAMAVAQVPAGGEFRVNSYTTGGQYDASVAVDKSGGFIVAWDSDGQDGDRGGIFARRFDAGGTPLGAEFRVNETTTDQQLVPAVAIDGRGTVLITWTGADQSGFGIFARRFAASGAPLGGEFQVNTAVLDDQLFPAVGGMPGGGFAIAWQSEGTPSGIHGRRYTTGGAPLGGEFQVNTNGAGQQDAAMSVDGAGVTTMVWESTQNGDSEGIYGQRYTAAGAPVGGEFAANSDPLAFNQIRPAVAASDQGFVVAWESFVGQDGQGSAVYAQRFDTAGAFLGAEFRVNTYTTSEQRQPAVATLGDGGFLIVWQSFPQDGSGFGVFGQRFLGSGARVGGEFRVNTYTTGYQTGPRVAADTVGNFVVAWESVGSDGPVNVGIAAQRYGGLLPSALSVDTSSNGVLEPGEAVDMRPTWRNVNGATVTFAGGLSGITGPSGATYTITDGVGDYGPVANGAQAPCTNCYGVAVSNPSPRPALHWDASVLESLTPGAQGQQKRWALHVGNSFTDVPPTGGFYRFVETLLHNGITGGCGPTTYCPASATTREQMAVFVLVAKEGSGYAPPACTTPVFNDVPAASGFCRWVEELARRGVVTGCGGGNYCPGDPVTREQMAIFVLRTLDPALSPPACVPPNLFADVPETSAFCRWIEELANRGIVTGCGGGNYCPSQAVTREQMGVFLSLTFGLTLYGV
jgi:S-layer homology domain